MPSSSDETPAEHHIPPWEYDAFVSHAGEDKAEVARPLAEALRELGLAVWYDEFELRIGDNLRRKIDAGIANSRFGIVILSEHFFAGQWPQYELDGIVTRHGVSGAEHPAYLAPGNQRIYHRAKPIPGRRHRPHHQRSHH